MFTSINQPWQPKDYSVFSLATDWEVLIWRIFKRVIYLYCRWMYCPAYTSKFVPKQIQMSDTVLIFPRLYTSSKSSLTPTPLSVPVATRVYRPHLSNTLPLAICSGISVWQARVIADNQSARLEIVCCGLLWHCYTLYVCDFKCQTGSHLSKLNYVSCFNTKRASYGCREFFYDMAHILPVMITGRCVVLLFTMLIVVVISTLLFLASVVL